MLGFDTEWECREIDEQCRKRDIMTLQEDRPQPGDDGSIRKSHYGEGKQPWDVAVEKGWAAAFAAGNVVKYLRRDKDPEHSLQSARWYYDRLKELASRNVRSHEAQVHASYVYKDLMSSLTDAEVMKLVQR